MELLHYFWHYPYLEPDNLIGIELESSSTNLHNIMWSFVLGCQTTNNTKLCGDHRSVTPKFVMPTAPSCIDNS